MKPDKKTYDKMTKKASPPTPNLKNCCLAFLVGGFICSIGQFIRYFFMLVFKMHGDELASATSVVLIFLGVLLTGLGVYDRIGKRAGGGSIVPITGFANSVVSSAIEARQEGFILGVGSNIFSLAGSVITYVVVSAVFLVIIKFLLMLVGVNI